MDALYAGALDEATRLLGVCDELGVRHGLDAAKVMAAREMFEGGLAYLREAGADGRKDAARGGRAG